jgi:hypothetical protein
MIWGLRKGAERKLLVIGEAATYQRTSIETMWGTIKDGLPLKVAVARALALPAAKPEGQFRR